MFRAINSSFETLEVNAMERKEFGHSGEVYRIKDLVVLWNSTSPETALP